MENNKEIKEFINSDGTMISGDLKNFDHKNTSRKTTDATILMTRQPFVFQNYRRYYGESTLPFNEVADKHKDTPGKFYNFLYEKGLENTFEDYFIEVKAKKEVKPANPKDTLKKAAKEKAFKMLEDLMSKTNDSSIISRNMPVTIEEIRDKENLILGKFDQMIEFFNQNMNESEKNVLLDYFKKSLNNG
jgi:hypothetical protein